MHPKALGDRPFRLQADDLAANPTLAGVILATHRLSSFRSTKFINPPVTREHRPL